MSADRASRRDSSSPEVAATLPLAEATIALKSAVAGRAAGATVLTLEDAADLQRVVR
jgi:hypothetical protein